MPAQASAEWSDHVHAQVGSADCLSQPSTAKRTSSRNIEYLGARQVIARVTRCLTFARTVA